MRINIDDTDMNDNLDYTYNGELFTGEIVETNAAGDIIELGAYRLGAEHGLQQAWYSDGQLKTEYTAVDNHVVGISRNWHHNGRLAEEKEFDDRGHLVAMRRWADDGTALEPDPPRNSPAFPDTGPNRTDASPFTYFAAIPPGRTRANPAGVIRRNIVGGHPVDEAFTRSLDWSQTTALREEQFGHTDTVHVEITEAEADAIVHGISTKLRDATQ